MHELSLASAIVNTAVKHAAGRRVRVVSMRIGALRQVVPSTLEFYFGFVTKDTVCEGATLEQELVPARLGCERCGEVWRIDLPVFACRRCGGEGQVVVVAGSEFEVESIEVEEEAGCIAPR